MYYTNNSCKRKRGESGKTTKRIKRTLVEMDDTCGSAVVRDIADVFSFETVSKTLLVVDIGTFIAAFVVGYNEPGDYSDIIAFIF